MILEYKKIDSVPEFNKLRKAYLDKLCEPQDLFLELIVRKSTPYIIKYGLVNAGHCAVNNNNQLVEFYLEDEFICKADHIFKSTLRNHEISKAYCKSFDHLFLTLCLKNCKDCKMEGILFRDMLRKKDTFKPLPIEYRLAELKDIPILAHFKEGIFEDEYEMIETIKQKGLIMFFKAGKLIAYGLFLRINDGRDDFDIGLAVHPRYRKQGYGTYIMQFLIHMCKENNWRPTAGCHIDNIASKKMIERAGFISKHNLIDFSF